MTVRPVPLVLVLAFGKSNHSPIHHLSGETAQLAVRMTINTSAIGRILFVDTHRNTTYNDHRGRQAKRDTFEARKTYLEKRDLPTNLANVSPADILGTVPSTAGNRSIRMFEAKPTFTSASFSRMDPLQAGVPSRARLMMRRTRDVFSKRKRSEVMARIRGKNTRLDLAMRELLIKNKIKFLTYPNIYGKPDFLLPPNIAVFCDSAFWHGKNWPTLKEQLMRGSRASYWVNHINNNRRRDAIVNKRLRREGFIVLRFWDKEIQGKNGNCIKRINETVNRGIKVLPSGD